VFAARGQRSREMWRILTWSAATQTGTVAGPHLGPLRFDGRLTSVRDFVPGEEVDVALEGNGAAMRVCSLSPLRARQPPGTEHAAFVELNPRKLYDFSVHSLESGALTIVGSDDLTYSHSVEVIFSEMTFLSLPVWFSQALFRLASQDEVAALRGQTDIDGSTFCIVTNHGKGPDGPKYFVIASSVECRRGTVFHDRREHLKPGERIAPWVK
jgi:hypothetical protein